ncbi:MAG: sigma-70 family RNA polymerase sigma factor [Clostridia bacterium]|nr:sigma-70 family RNA polymerase sigma factor [Clostridia bacterium]
MEENLLKEAQNGSADAVNALLKGYKSLVNKIARSYFLIGGDMEDIVQEGMIGLYKAIINFSSDKHASFKTFASLCIKHQFQTVVKVASSEKNMMLSTALPITERVHDEEDEEIEILIPSALPSPDDKVLQREKMQELQKAITSALSPLENKILALYLQGYSYNEIAQMGNLNKKSIDNGLSRIKHKLSFLKKREK